MKSALIWGQCLTYALGKWHTTGGRIHFRRSSHWPIAHVQHTDDMSQLSHFVPPGDLKTPAHAMIGFYGEVLHHDTTPCRPMSVFGIVLSAFLLLAGVLIWSVITVGKKLLRPIP